MASPYAAPASSPATADPAAPPQPANGGLAGVLSFIDLGAGHVYVGRWGRGFVLFGAMTGATLVFGLLGRPLYRALGIGGFVLAGILPFGVWLFALRDAVRLAAARVKHVPVWVVLLWALAFWIGRIVVTFGFRVFFLESFKVPSAGDMPTIFVGDHIFVDKLTPHLRAPRRGEMIVFPFPEHPEQNFLKRVVALPGDTVQTVDGALVINGWHVPRCRAGTMHYDDYDGGRTRHEGDVWVEFLGDSSYLVFEERSGLPIVDGTWHVAPGQVFVMGDNRENSHDSRMWYGGSGGGVPIPTVRGMTLTAWLSITDEGLLWSRFGADLTGNKPLAPPDLADSLAKCMASRPAGTLGPP